MNLCTVTKLVIAIVGRGTNPDTIVGLRAAAAGGRRRRHGISAAALFAGRREAGPQKANAARWNQKKRALNAMNLSTMTKLVIPIVGHGTDLGAIVE